MKQIKNLMAESIENLTKLIDEKHKMNCNNYYQRMRTTEVAELIN